MSELFELWNQILIGKRANYVVIETCFRADKDVHGEGEGVGAICVGDKMARISLIL